MRIAERIPGNGPARSARPGGAASAGRFPLARLLQLIGLLQAGRFPNARRLAEICEVSPRTIYRDLASLTDAGLSVLYRPDRQGYELEQHVLLSSPRLDERDVLAILVHSRRCGEVEDLGLESPAFQAIDKAIQGLPPESRTRLIAASEVLAEPPRQCRTHPIRQSLHDDILAAVARRRQVRLWLRLRKPRDSAQESTKFAIYRMIPIDRDWCLVGRSTLHRGVTSIPLVRIERAELTGDTYEIPPRFDLGRFLDRDRRAARDAGEEDGVVLRFSARTRTRADAAPWPRRPRRNELDDGGIELILGTDPCRDLLPILLGFGTDLEVISPPSLRAALAAYADEIARHHAVEGTLTGSATVVNPDFNPLPLAVGG